MESKKKGATFGLVDTKKGIRYLLQEKQKN